MNDFEFQELYQEMKYYNDVMRHSLKKVQGILDSIGFNMKSTAVIKENRESNKTFRIQNKCNMEITYNYITTEQKNRNYFARRGISSDCDCENVHSGLAHSEYLWVEEQMEFLVVDRVKDYERGIKQCRNKPINETEVETEPDDRKCTVLPQGPCGGIGAICFGFLSRENQTDQLKFKHFMVPTLFLILDTAGCIRLKIKVAAKWFIIDRGKLLDQDCRLNKMKTL